MPKFFETRMGQQFYNTTIPAMVRQLTRLNENLEKMIALQSGEKPQTEKPKTKKSDE